MAECCLQLFGFVFYTTIEDSFEWMESAEMKSKEFRFDDVVSGGLSRNAMTSLFADRLPVPPLNSSNSAQVHSPSVDCSYGRLDGFKVGSSPLGWRICIYGVAYTLRA